MTVLRSGSATDVGRVRTVNQDLPLEEPNLFAVADGMGGHVGGEVAARVAVETLVQAFDRAPTVEGLREAFSVANAAVWRESQSNAGLRGMGTTLTAMALAAGDGGRDVVTLANVGDSRAYIYSGGTLTQVTDDHSLAEERMRHGEMTEEEAAVHPQRHILTRALGVGPDVDVDMWELGLHSGDRVVLCSDGLSNEVSLDEMAAVLGQNADPGEAARQLVGVANEHGGSDNITVVVVDVQVGEAGVGAPARVTPLALAAGGAGPAVDAVAGAALTSVVEVAPPGRSPDPSDTAVLPLTAPVRDDDTLAPGTRLGFGDEPGTLADSGPESDEFFVGAAGSVPVARSTARVPPPPRQAGAPEKESRGERRRRLGIPRRVTFRVIGFVVLVAAVFAGGYFVLRWYAYDNWIVTVQHEQVVVVQGQRGGVLWFHPKVVDRTGETAAQIDPSAWEPLKAGVAFPSLKEAKNYVQSIGVATTTTTTIPTTSTTTARVPNPKGVGTSSGAPAATTTVGAVAP